MKKSNNIGRRLGSIILALALMLGITTNVFAGWETYNSGISANGVYLQETWVGGKQCINFWKNGEWVRNIAGEGHTLWINSIPVLYTLYDTQHWCYDQYGNCFAIDNNQKLLLCRINSTGFVVNNSITGCTGFARDNNKVGYLLYTNNGNYNLSDLLNGTVSNTNQTTAVPSLAPYSYDDIVTQHNNYYWYDYNGRQFTYKILGKCLYCNDELISDDVKKIAFAYGSLIYVTDLKPSKVYKISIGKVNGSTPIGTKFKGFDYDSKGWVISVQLEGKTVNVNSNYSNSSNNSSNNNYNYNYGYSYPYVKVSGDYYYYYASKSKYYKYSWDGSSLYYKGTNNINSNLLISSSVYDITFWNGYIVYAFSSGKVYKLGLGKGSSSSKKQVGKKPDFSYFDGEGYISEGYYNTDGRYISFDDSSNIDEDYPYVEWYVKNYGNYYCYNKSNTKTYEYCLKNSTLYYDGEKLEKSVKKVTFSDEGYIIYATTSGYVYAYPVGKTSSSYRKYIGKYFEYFDDDDYMSDGYYNKYDDYVDFDF